MLKESKTMEIELELAHGYFETREIPIELGSFTAATEVAFEILQAFGKNSKTCFAVYLVLLKHRNMKNNKCFPSIATIAEETNIGIRTVKDTLNTLSSSGYLSINSGMRGISNNYYFPKEWFYKYFEDDINQNMASRRKSVMKSERKLKAEKELETANDKIKDMKKEIEKKDALISKLSGKLEQNHYQYIENNLDEDDPF